MGWTNNLVADPSELDIDGRDVRVAIGDEQVTVYPADGGDPIGTADSVLLEDPVFSDGRDVYGKVDGIGQSAQISWNIEARLFANDMFNAVPVDGAGFEVSDVIRMNDESYEIGDPVESALYGYVTADGVGVMLPHEG